jgi:hypothetical protein
MLFARRILRGAMFLVVCSAVAALACNDVDRPVGPREPKPIAQQEAPPIVLSLTCDLNGSTSTVSCTPVPPTPPAGVNASVIYGATATYAIFFPYNLVKDTVTHTWQFTAYLQNLLKQSIGTLNGTTTTGVKVFVTDFHATSGTGTVSVANADGTGTFTAPNQPYFNYNQIIAPSGYSGNKLWKFSVPNTVTAVSMSILLSTDFPAEQTVFAIAPDTEPSWFALDSNWSGTQMKRVISVGFRTGTTLADRQLAVAYVNGTIVGGVQGDGDEGVYLVSIASDGSTDALTSAMNRIALLPQVEFATETARGTPSSLRPTDGANWTSWSLAPDSALASQRNWSPEQIDAPLAWGCSTGSASTNVSILDHGFEAGELSTNVAFGSATFGLYPSDPGHHGSLVAAMVAARGNDSTGMTGTMWRAGLRLRDFGTPFPTFTSMARLVRAEGIAGSKIVNLSYGLGITTHTAADSARAYRYLRVPLRILKSVNAAGHMPLLVLSSGDSSVSATFSSWPILHDSLPHRILVAGGTTITHAVAPHSGFGRLIDVYAPSEDIWTEYGAGANLRQTAAEGSSFAAPQIAGIAGLLLAFDSTLTADSLKQYIVHGALNGGRVIHDPDGTIHYLADAYESLKLAAQRAGAPLCGNHVWIAGTNIMVQRTATMSEAIYSDSGFPNGLDVKHGGHRIFYGNDNFTNEIAYDSPTRTWKVSTDGNNPPPATDGGAYNSSLGMSHNGDSILVNDLTSRSTDHTSVTYSVKGYPTGAPRTLATILTGLVQGPYSTACVMRYNANPSACIDSVLTGPSESARVFAAFSPRGGRAVIVISPVKVVRSVASTWTRCANSPTPPAGQATDCLAFADTSTSLDSKFFSISTDVPTTPVSSFATLTAVQVQQLGISEDGMELFIGRGELHGVPASNFATYSNCGYSFLTIATTTFSTLIPSEFACNWLGTVTTSPRRIAAGGPAL